MTEKPTTETRRHGERKPLIATRRSGEKQNDVIGKGLGQDGFATRLEFEKRKFLSASPCPRVSVLGFAKRRSKWNLLNH